MNTNYSFLVRYSYKYSSFLWIMNFGYSDRKMMPLTEVWNVLSVLLTFFVTISNCHWLCDLIDVDCSTETPVMLMSAKPRPTWHTWDFLRGTSLPTGHSVASSLLICTAYAATNKFFALLYFRGKWHRNIFNRLGRMYVDTWSSWYI